MTDPGDFPRNLEPNVRRFAALTKLQYQRFEIWKDDKEFYLEDDKIPTPKSRIEQVGLDDQPGELTRASLESTIGDPLYPGLEMYWVAKLETTVGLW